MNGSQVRAARGLLNWSQDRLATVAGVSSQTVKRLEADSSAALTHETETKIRDALVNEGIDFIHEIDDDGFGRLGVTIRIFDEMYRVRTIADLFHHVATTMRRIREIDASGTRRATVEKLEGEIEKLVEDYEKTVGKPMPREEWVNLPKK